MKQYCILYNHNGFRYAEYATFDGHCCPTCRNRAFKHKRQRLSRMYGGAVLVFFFRKTKDVCGCSERAPHAMSDGGPVGSPLSDEQHSRDTE
jgi:hypothetical protein